ncbi:MAG: endonuclease NucS [Candidatus Bathyarchaeia archaeon]
MSIEKIRVDNPQELGQMITKEMSQIEKDLTMICNNVPINDRTTLDVLCHDNNGQLVIIQLSVKEDDIMLLQGIQSLDYVDKFKSFLKATYNKHKIDDKERPRLILIAPSFSDALKRAVESMKGMRIDLYEWEYLKLGDHKGLRLQPIFTWTPHEKPKESEEKPQEKKREPKPVKKKGLEPEPKPEKKEEPRPEPPKPKPEPPKEEFPLSPPPPVPPKEEEPKRKLKLF